MALKRNKDGLFILKTKADLEECLQQFDDLFKRTQPANDTLISLKAAATKYAVDKGIDVVQLDGVYFRQQQRYNRFWAGTDDEIPTDAQKKARSLKSIVSGKTAKVNGKKISLWQLITKRVPDPEKIQTAVAKGWISEKEIKAAFIEKPQAPFLQRYEGNADGG